MKILHLSTSYRNGISITKTKVKTKARAKARTGINIREVILLMVNWMIRNNLAG